MSNILPRSTLRVVSVAVLTMAIHDRLAEADEPSGAGGWELSHDTYDKSKIAELCEKILNADYKRINGIVVTKDGKLLVEEYFNGASRDSLHNPRSVGKTFASAILGIAIRDRHLESVDQRLGDLYDLSKSRNTSAKKANVTIRDLLTMTSGFDGDDSDPGSAGNEEKMYPEPNWVSWALDLPMAADRDPGGEWRYFTAGAVLLGDILNSRVPGGLETYAEEQLLRPLGILNYRWQHTPQGVANTAGGIQMSALDFAKFGQLFKNGGMWNDTHVLPADWVTDSLSRQFTTTVPPNSYGYLWWCRDYIVNGANYEVAYCSGNGGNKIYVFKNAPLVVVVTASAYNQGYAHSQVDEIMERYIIPAVLSDQ